MTTATTATASPNAGARRRGAADGSRLAPAGLDQSTLVAAYGAHRAAAYSLAYGILGDGSAAEDAVQDAFVKLWRGAVQFDPSRGSMRGLLLTITRHTSIDAIRRRTRRKSSERTYSTGLTHVTDGPECTIERSEHARGIRRALAEVPSGQRTVLEMAYFTGLTRAQIAAEMAIPVGTVKSRIRLGLRRLAFTLGDS